MYTPPQTWRSKSSKYRFVGSRCLCGKTYFPRREFCVLCGKKPNDLSFSGSVVIETYTVIYNAPEGFVGPYVAGIVRTKEGPLVPTQIVGPMEKMKIGAPVSLRIRRIYEDGDAGLLVFGFKFEID